ncbi:Succinyl-diaminopimelate desuccinylase [Austwickia sp. TVS 96-490-7B]|uniref:dipeptidase n=1 Tax=Austwickia sp. TVS 96-490-7B TaxID=2830843 RepID=UPI001C55DE53|nr:dipeptidase [Austwickia sp. TVS 96-490-7B]MBW3086080.1 Succinyl-diaminopimelate desuccinylase [Austwickia sp. TVS 96-490-7B]
MNSHISQTDSSSARQDSAVSINGARREELAARVAAAMPGLRTDLESLVRIPSVSLGSFPAEEVARSADRVAELLRGEGLDVEVVQMGDGHPAVLGHKPGPVGAPRVLLYAHHDVQPPGAESDWDTPPFEPTERGGRLYARGAADDKAGVMAHVAALRVLGDELGVDLRVIVEGEEEVGSQSLAGILSTYREQLDCDAIVLADSSNWAVGTPALTTTLRGNVRVVITVTALEHGVHSGMFGGAAPDALTALCRLLSTLHTEEGGVAIDGLVSDEASDLIYDEDQFRSDAGLPAGAALIGTGSVVSRLWSQPSATVIGIDAPSVDTAANLLLPQARAKVSVRLAPSQDWRSAWEAIRTHLQANAPWGTQVEVELEDHGNGFVAPTSGSYVDAARASFAQAWGVDPVDTGIGGSIPFIAEFAEQFPQAAILVTGVEDPDTRAHGANESLHLGEFERVCLAEALLLDTVARSVR